MKLQVDITEKVAETMLGPLWARATYAPKYPEILDDPKAYELINNLDYDFSEIEKIGEWRAIGLLARARHFDDTAKKYIENHPQATIVSIGSGLDTTFYRLNNGNINWVDVDLPEIIKLRKELLPEPDRVIYIAKSAFDYSWIEDMQIEVEKGIFIIAGGFVYYFTENEIISLLTTFRDRFPGGEMIFDAVSKLATRVTNRRAKKVGSNLRLKFALRNVNRFVLNKLEGIELVSSILNGYNIPTHQNWSKETKRMVRAMRVLKTAKIIHLRF